MKPFFMPVKYPLIPVVPPYITATGAVNLITPHRSLDAGQRNQGLVASLLKRKKQPVTPNPCQLVSIDIIRLGHID